MADQALRGRAADGLHEDFGPRLRAERERHGLSVRALAREVGISPSALSQIETGRSRPSVRTLYSIVSELNITLDELFNPDAASSDPSRTEPVDRDARDDDSADKAGPGQRKARGPVQRADLRTVINLESGVRWERLTAARDPEVDFMHVVYGVGAASSLDKTFLRHAGREYGVVLSGRLRVATGFECHELGPGDSISFDSSIPHLIENIGDEPVNAVWVVVGRNNDPRNPMGNVDED